MNYLLDTNIIAEYLRGKLTFKQGVAIDICIPVLGELFVGANKSNNPVREVAKIEAIAIHYRVLQCDLETSRRYAIIRNALEASGGRIPENDMWIAALAVQHNLILVTRDAHFARIPNLTVETW